MLNLSQRLSGRNVEPDLFGPAPTSYPESPGSKSPHSREAARQIANHAGTVRGIILAEYRAAFPRGLTADEVAKLAEESVLTARPRVSELGAQGLLERTCERRKNDSGMTAAVWRASPKAMEATR
jgi:hypothetical protein